MVPRQVWLFQLGCWVALATSVVHMLAHVTGSMAGAGPSSIAGDAHPTHVWLVPGLWQPSFTNVLDGFSLMVAMLTATIGAAGLAVLHYGETATRLTRQVARVFAVGTSMCLAVSVAMTFSVETFFVATTAMCFALASVTPE